KQVAVLKSKEEPDKKESVQRAEVETTVDQEDPDGKEDQDKVVLKTDPGLHRVVWDLRLRGAEPIKKAKIDWGDPEQGPLALPGTYTLKLNVEGKSYTTKLTVEPDPRLAAMTKPASANPSGLEVQQTLTLRVRDDINRLSGMVHQLRAVRKQLL